MKNLPASGYAVATVFMWSSLAALTVQINSLPPLLMLAVSLTCASGLSVHHFRQWRAPLKDWAIGLLGIFGYHWLLFSALTQAPAVNANLVQYSWPLLIVIGSTLMQANSHFTKTTLMAIILGIGGLMLALANNLAAFQTQHIKGYLFAIAAAFAWASYSLLNAKRSNQSTGLIGGFCFVGAIIAWLSLYIGTPSFSIATVTTQQWLVMLALGFGPMGLAFYTWDIAMKKGDAKFNGTLCYATPVLSTLFILIVAQEPLTLHLAIAVTLVTISGIVAAKERNNG
ncbi:DMT family transporter [Paraferrimonas sp. SM1919]|uniref:DMT family transporter n=1 Tax=Paraferrimonas sp. SM1919 TaxID=2662263 RepID=UPI0013D2396E|nr:DMT family transporter [Paraferrimonas sp. SM1919]